MSTAASVAIQEADSIATIRVDDGKVNALSEGLLSALSEALDVAIARDRAALLIGRDGFLSAGFDLSVMRAGPDARRSLVLAGLELALKIFESPIPVIVCCTGHAIAAGTLLLLPSEHVIVAGTPVKIGFNETTIGIELSPFVLELARYRLLPSAYNQILQGTLCDAVAALHAGYVDEIVGPEELLPRSLEVASHFAQLDPTSYRRTKRAMRSATASALHSALARRRGAVDN
jgi:enoyl-CoA hydratase